MKKLTYCFVFCLLTACAAATPVAVTPTPLPTPTEVRILPTPAAPGDSVNWQGLQVSMAQSEIVDSFITEFGSQRLPSPGLRFFWVQVQLTNTTQSQVAIPDPEHFSVLYAATELKPTYGHRQAYPDYTALGTVLFPDQTVTAWLRFDIPDTAELNDLRFVYLPESFGVGTSFSSPIYPYSEDHPTFVWECAP